MLLPNGKIYLLGLQQFGRNRFSYLAAERWRDWRSEFRFLLLLKCKKMYFKDLFFIVLIYSSI